MKKDELVQAIAESADVSKADADRVLKALVDTVTSGVGAGPKIQIPGRGTVDARARHAPEGRNPQTGETIQIAATTVPGFKAATAFKDSVAGS
jgi:DNA-binding protein HU-beta